MTGRRAAVAVALMAALAGCTDSAVPDPTAPSAVTTPRPKSSPPSSTATTGSTAAPATAVPTTTTLPTTTAAPTTTAPTTTIRATTTPPTGPPATPPGSEPPVSPHAVLSAFRGRIEVTLAGADGIPGVRAVADGTYVAGNVACDLTASFGTFGIEEAVVLIDGEAWFKAAGDTDFAAVAADDPQVSGALDGCPAGVGFWVDFDPGPIAGLPGTADARNGIPARRVDASDGLAAGLALGLVGDLPDGVIVARFLVWIADDGGYLAGVDVAFTMPPDVAEAEFGIALAGEVTFAFTIDVLDPDDPTLAVTPP